MALLNVSDAPVYRNRHHASTAYQAKMTCTTINITSNSRTLPVASRGCPATMQRAPSTCSDGENSPQLVDPQPLVLPTISAIFTTNIPNLHHVPKALRDRWARLLQTNIRAVCDTPTVNWAWVSLIICCKCLLASPAAGNRLWWHEILKLVWLRMVYWEEGDLQGLWSEAILGTLNLLRRCLAMSPENSQINHNIKRAKLAVQDGQFWEALQALSSAGLAEASKEPLLPHCTRFNV